MTALRALADDPDGQLSELSVARATRLLRTLAEPARVEILVALADGPADRDDISRRLQHHPSTVTEHLRALQQAGLVRRSVGTENRHELSEHGRRLVLRVLELLGLPAV